MDGLTEYVSTLISAVTEYPWRLWSLVAAPQASISQEVPAKSLPLYLIIASIIVGACLQLEDRTEPPAFVSSTKVVILHASTAHWDELHQQLRSATGAVQLASIAGVLLLVVVIIATVNILFSKTRTLEAYSHAIRVLLFPISSTIALLTAAETATILVAASSLPHWVFISVFVFGLFARWYLVLWIPFRLAQSVFRAGRVKTATTTLIALGLAVIATRAASSMWEGSTTPAGIRRESSVARQIRAASSDAREAERIMQRLNVNLEDAQSIDLQFAIALTHKMLVFVELDSFKKIAPPTGDCRNNKACFEQFGRVVTAFERLESSLSWLAKRYPDLPVAQVFVGDLYVEALRCTEAVTAYETAYYYLKSSLVSERLYAGDRLQRLDRAPANLADFRQHFAPNTGATSLTRLISADLGLYIEALFDLTAGDSELADAIEELMSDVENPSPSSFRCKERMAEWDQPISAYKAALARRQASK